MSGEQLAEQLRDIKALEHFAYPPGYYVVAVILALALFYILWRLFKKWRDSRRPVAPPSSSIPLHERILEQLKSLKEKDAYKEKGERIFHFLLSEIFRNYLEGRYFFCASDMTTEEVMRAMEENRELDNEKKALIRKLLGEGDMVKFADVSLGEVKAFEMLNECVEFVEETENSRVSSREDQG